MDDMDHILNRLRAVEIDQGRLDTDHRELATAFWGDNTNRDNGLRSDVRKVEGRTTILETDLRDFREEFMTYKTVERKNSCYGLEALTAVNGEATQVKVARINGRGQMIVGIASPLVMLLIYLLGLLGMGK